MTEQTEQNNLGAIALAAMRGRITKIIPAQIRECVERLNTEQLWWRPGDEANSVGNLVLHLSGSIRHYICRGVGGVDFVRDRPAEFAERGPIPKDELLSTWDEAVKQVTEVLDGFSASRLLDATDEQDYVPTLFHLIYNVSIHMATHAGQIIWVTKMLEQGSLNELWIRAHKA
jgi:uncharacterized damage-inducible protein DinB